MPVTDELQKAIVNNYYRDASNPTYLSIFQVSTAAEVGTLGAQGAGVGYSEIFIGGINGTLADGTLLRIGNDIDRIYKIREAVTGDGTTAKLVKIHPPLAEAIGSTYPSVTHMRECSYTNYARQEMTFDAPTTHGDTDTSAKIEFPAVAGLATGASIDILAGATWSAATTGMMLDFKLVNPAKQLANGDKFVVPVDQSSIAWAYA